MLSQGRQNMCRRLWHTQTISRKFAAGVIQLPSNHFAVSMFKALGYTFPERLRREIPRLLVLTSVS